MHGARAEVCARDGVQTHADGASTGGDDAGSMTKRATAGGQGSPPPTARTAPDPDCWRANSHRGAGSARGQDAARGRTSELPRPEPHPPDSANREEGPVVFVTGARERPGQRGEEPGTEKRNP